MSKVVVHAKDGRTFEFDTDETGVEEAIRALMVAGVWPDQIAQTVHLIPEGKIPSITCPQCGKTSYNQTDVREGYCGQCHQWHADMPIDGEETP
jgi:Zn finger protein HypA/HybF involved in hydrogenase expression